jgi:oxazoline/thiazoline synthase
VPVVVAVTSDRATGRRIGLGAAAHPDLGRAARDAATEALQLELSAELGRCRREADPGAEVDAGMAALLAWTATATLAGHPHLLPDSGAMPPPSCRETDLSGLPERLARAGLRAWVVDLTGADLGVPAVRVVAPGLRPWRPRFAPGRLYDAAPRLGWAARRLEEAELNPLPMVL